MQLGPYRASKCTTPRHSKLLWHLYTDAVGQAVVHGELKALLVDPALDPSVLKARLADLRALLDEAALGQLVEQGEQTPNVKKIASQPDLWELRWETEDGGRWRMYHAEPDKAPGYLVSLRVHRKDLTGTRNEIRERQNEHIEVAADRYRDGEPHSWGIP